MNILLVSNHFNAGGISSYILNLAEGLKARGHRVYVASGGGEWVDRLERINVEHIRVPLGTKSILSAGLISAYKSLKEIVYGKQAQIIHTQTRVSSVLAYFLARKCKIGFVGTWHGFYRNNFGRAVLPCWPERIIAISEAVCGHLIKDFKVSPQKIAIVHNGINTENYQAAAATEKALYKKSFGLENNFVIGIVARLSEVKGHKYLLLAMKEVINEFNNSCFLSIGGGRLKKSLEAQAACLGIRDKVFFVDSMPDTRKAYAAMDVFVMPSLQEGLGLSIMEAMASGVPVIASRAGGILSLIKHNETGLLVEPKNPQQLACAIIDILKNKDKAGVIGTSGRDFILKEFSLADMAYKTEQVYKSIECVN